MLRFLLELLPALLLGFWGGRRYPTLSGRLAMPLVRFGVPISVMGLLLRGGLGGEMVAAAVLAMLAITVVLLLTQRLPSFTGLGRPYTPRALMASRISSQRICSFGGSGASASSASAFF